jgi:uncharacterized membrane protein YhaH (DUF805 family)
VKYFTSILSKLPDYRLVETLRKEHPMSATQFAAIEPGYAPPSLGEFLFSFHGRISRYQYWVQYFLPYILLSVMLTVADMAAGSYDSQTGLGLLSSIFSLVALWSSLAIGVKRCHDRDRSGWFLLLYLIPIIGAIWLFVELGCLRGSIGGNRFGPDPVIAR